MQININENLEKKIMDIKTTESYYYQLCNTNADKIGIIENKLNCIIKIYSDSIKYFYSKFQNYFTQNELMDILNCFNPKLFICFDEISAKKQLIMEISDFLYANDLRYCRTEEQKSIILKKVKHIRNGEIYLGDAEDDCIFFNGVTFFCETEEERDTLYEKLNCLSEIEAYVLFLMIYDFWFDCDNSGKLEKIFFNKNKNLHL